MIITAGLYKGQKIKSPNEKITRPTLSKTRMGVFNTLNSIIGEFENKSFLDVFGGSGIMSIEAISRGFSYVEVFELNKHAVQIIKSNYKNLGINPNIKIGDSRNLIKNSTRDFDVIFVDPPYNSELYRPIINSVKSGIIVLEHSKDLNISDYNIIKTKKYGETFVTYINMTL